MLQDEGRDDDGEGGAGDKVNIRRFSFLFNPKLKFAFLGNLTITWNLIGINFGIEHL